MSRLGVVLLLAVVLGCPPSPAPGAPAPAPKPAADWPAFPSTTGQPRGMSYRQWLIGQALSGCAERFAPAQCAIDAADAVIALDQSTRESK